MTIKVGKNARCIDSFILGDREILVGMYDNSSARINRILVFEEAGKSPHYLLEGNIGKEIFEKVYKGEELNKGDEICIMAEDRDVYTYIVKWLEDCKCKRFRIL